MNRMRNHGRGDPCRKHRGPDSRLISGADQTGNIMHLARWSILVGKLYVGLFNAQAAHLALKSVSLRIS